MPETGGMVRGTGREGVMMQGIGFLIYIIILTVIGMFLMFQGFEVMRPMPF